MKMSRTSNTDIVRNCQSYFGFKLPTELWSNRVKCLISYMSRAGAALSVMALTSDRLPARLFFYCFFCSPLSEFACCVNTISISDE